MVLLGMGVYRRFVKPWVILAVLALVAGVIFVFQGDITDRLLTADDRGSAESRLPLNEMAWRIIQDHPVLGIGLNNYDLAMQDYITPDLSGEWVYIVHNRYLLVWSETGIGSLAAYLALIFLGIAGSWQAIRLKDPMLSPIALGAFAGCCGILFHFAVDIFSGRNMLEMLWLMAGLQIVAWRVGVREPYDFQIEYADPPTRIRREIGQPLPNGANQGLDQEWGEWTSTT
jgi:O-antigen ligase